MTALKHAGRPGANDERSAYDIKAFRADLEQQRQFRVEQLRDLIRNRWARPGCALDEVTSALATAAATALADIDAALRRIEVGTFGRCQQCEGAIALDRLKALPTARRCMSCQYAQETSEPDGAEPSTRAERRSPPSPAPAPPRTQPVLRESVYPDIVDIWGTGSFPASDPPANW